MSSVPATPSRPILAYIALLLVAMISIQVGAAVAKHVFPVIGPAGTTALRLSFGSLISFAVFRPWRMRPSRREIRAIVIYGLAMGWMNLFFYRSLEEIPLGIAVALEFTGPLAVAMAASRRGVDFLWIALALAGLLALLPLRVDMHALPLKGIAFALAAGACWAIYILAGQKAGNSHAGQIAAWGMVIGAVVIVPLGVAQAGMKLLLPAVLPMACAVALLSSALPYSLEMVALRRVPARTFGVLMSMEPALAALSGLLLLGERLGGIQWLAIGCIMVASAGSAWTGSNDHHATLVD